MKLTRANKGFLFGLIGTPSMIVLTTQMPQFGLVLMPLALVCMAFFTFGGLLSVFEYGDEKEMEAAYEEQL